MQNSPFLSIVIPVYNGAKVIDRCLNSIWEQGLDESIYEVICVNDCSNDNTAEIIKQNQLYHCNLRLLSNLYNKRAGGSRNYGVKEAQGKYIVFIDADDYFHPKSLLEVLNILKSQALDILVCDFARHTINCPNNILIHNFVSTEIMSGRKFMVVNSLPHAPWKYVFKRELMIDNNCFFEENVNCKDVDWTHKIVFYAKTMKYVPILLIHYILEPNSQTGSEFKKSMYVINKILCGYRTMQLVNLCNTEEEKNYIIRVAESVYIKGLIFFNTLSTSPIKKREIITHYIITEKQSGLLGLATKYPTLYSLLSTFISPLFRSLLTARRYINGR